MKKPAIKRWTMVLATLIISAAEIFMSASAPASAEMRWDHIPVHTVTSCAQHSTEGLADAEWSSYMRNYSQERERECLAEGLSPDAWRDGKNRAEDAVYGSADWTSRQRLGEIARKYGLKLCGDAAALSEAQIPRITDSQSVKPVYCFDSGAFGVSGRVNISGWLCDFVYEECPVGVMGFWSRSGEHMNKYSQWSYTLPCGDSLWIDMGASDSGGYSGYRQVLLYCRSGDRIITVRGSVPNDRVGAEAFADCFGEALNDSPHKT